MLLRSYNVSHVLFSFFCFSCHRYWWVHAIHVIFYRIIEVSLRRDCPSASDATRGRSKIRGYPAKRALPAMLMHGRQGPFGRIPSNYLNQTETQHSKIRTANKIRASTVGINTGDAHHFNAHGYPLLWRHNGRDNVSNHQPHVCFFNRLFRRRSKKTSKLCVTGLCAGNSPVNGEFPAQMASNAEIFPFDDVIMILMAQ